MKTTAAKVVFGILGIAYWIFMIAGAINSIGQTVIPKTLTVWDAVTTIVVLFAAHISIEWIKDLFEEE